MLISRFSKSVCFVGEFPDSPHTMYVTSDKWADIRVQLPKIKARYIFATLTDAQTESARHLRKLGFKRVAHGSGITLWKRVQRPGKQVGDWEHGRTFCCAMPFAPTADTRKKQSPFLEDFEYDGQMSMFPEKRAPAEAWKLCPGFKLIGRKVK